MKINILTLILYILSVSLLIAASVIYEQPSLVLFVFSFLALIPISFIVFNIVSKNFEFSLYSESEYVEEPNPPVFVFSYENKKHLGLFTCDVELQVENAYFPNEASHKIAIPLVRKSNTFKIPIEVTEIGLISARVKKITLNDYLSLFKKEIEPEFEISIPVLPKGRSISNFPPAVPKDGPDEYTESDNTGNVSSDVKEIREYRPGDRLQRIHWKLSAKLDDLFVKEMSHTSSLAIILIPELYDKDIHDTADTLISCVRKMIQLKERFELYIYNDKACEFSVFVLTDEEKIPEIMTHFYCQPLYEGRDNALNTFLSSTDKNATVVHIVGKQIQYGEQEETNVY